MISYRVFFTTLLSTLVLSNTSKDSKSLCQSMLSETKFNAKPQTSTVPFQVLLDKDTVHPGEIVTLLLSPIGDQQFIVRLILNLKNPIVVNFFVC